MTNSIEVDNDWLEDVNTKDINILIGIAIYNYGNNNIPECIVWQYRDEYLLPSRIDKNKFLENTDRCIPLKNMFILAGITEIWETFEKETSRTNGVRNLLERVANTATIHIRDIWKEYETSTIDLSIAWRRVTILCER